VTRAGAGDHADATQGGPKSWARRGWSQTASLLALLVILLAIAARLPLLTSHFGHIDDSAVAAAILDAKTGRHDLASLVHEAQTKVREGHGTARVSALLRLAEAPSVQAGWRLVRPVYPLVVVPLKMTYAPLQFLLTGALLQPGYSYEQIKFWGRLPSLLASAATLALMAPLARRLWPEVWSALFLLMVSVIGFSLEYTIMGAQMHAYAAAATATAALMALLASSKVSELDRLSPALLRLALLPAALCYLSYQTLLLLPGFYLALSAGVVATIPRSRWAPLAFRLVLFGAVAGVLVAPAYVFRIHGLAAIGWNAGPAGEFVMGRTAEGAAAFFSRNLWITTQALTAPLAEDHPALPMITGLVVLMSGVGACALAGALRPSRWGPKASLGVMIGVSFGVLLALVASGRLSLGPTRHLIFILPMIAVLFGVGVCSATVALGRVVGSAAPPYIAACGVAALLTCAYVWSYPTFLAERRDAFDEAHLTQLAKSQGADLVVGYGATLQPLLMPSVARIAPVAVLEDLQPPAAGQATPRTLLLVSHRGAFGAATCALLRDRFGLPPTADCLGSVQAAPLEARSSPVEVEYSRRTQNGTNGFYATRISLPARAAVQ